MLPAFAFFHLLFIHFLLLCRVSHRGHILTWVAFPRGVMMK
jgi:hypothetical protein